jgi:ssDNA-binding Zn-finger/Zn-ribbon topoisomerase 1
MAKTCPKCGGQMLHYENPDRWVCINIKKHDAIERSFHRGGRREGSGRKKKKDK